MNLKLSQNIIKIILYRYIYRLNLILFFAMNNDNWNLKHFILYIYEHIKLYNNINYIDRTYKDEYIE